MKREEFIEEWIKALESGEYKQTKGRLRTGVGHCCLGVYAEVNSIPISGYGDDMMINNENVGYKPIMDIIGQSNVNKLWSMNDTDNKNFEEIADWLEENL